MGFPLSGPSLDLWVELWVRWSFDCEVLLFSDPRCLGYATPGHPERPARVERSVAWIQERHPEWEWGRFESVALGTVLRVHSQSHLNRFAVSRDFDADTAYHEGIIDLALLSAGAALATLDAALEGRKAFALMRPPGHHAERERAMGFCYLNNVAICALEAQQRGWERVAIWDFDAHHGNGTEAIVNGIDGIRFSSVHQHPCYPGTGTESFGNCCNYPVAPHTPAEAHLQVLRRSWKELLDFRPDLVLVSAGFDAYESDPITQMSLRMKDFRTLGSWLNESPAPVACLLEGGYSDDLPELIGAFLEGWEGQD